MLSLKNAGSSYTLSMPNFPYKTLIEMNLDSADCDDGKIDWFDNGAAYDRRSCEVDLDLTAEEAAKIDTLFITNRVATINLVSTHGFFPYGPDKGDALEFVSSVEVIEYSKAQGNPKDYFHIKLRLINAGTYPTYSPPSERDEGELTIDSVTGIRFPQEWFDVASQYASSLVVPPSKSPKFIDRGPSADRYRTSAKLILGEGKAAALVGRVVDAIRGNTFQLIPSNNFYPFGYVQGNVIQSVKIESNQLEIVHENHDRFTMNLKVVKV
jgi:hypothetical protein